MQRRTRRSASTIGGAASDTIIGRAAADRAGARPYRAARCENASKCATPDRAGARLRHRFCFRREATAHSVLRYDAWKHAVEEIIYSAGFRSAAGHLESAERVATDDCTGDGPIDVEVSDQKFRTHSSDVLRAA